MEGAPGTDLPRRRAIKASVSALLADKGFEAAEDMALETLTEMTISFIHELGRSSKIFCEASCRIEPLVSDIVLGLIEMGQTVEELPAYAKSGKQTLLLPPTLALATPNPRIMQTGEKQSHPAHIPDHLPAFPDPHTYIHTQTHRCPSTEYQAVREKAASQKRDVERALTRFIAKTGDTENLFSDDPYAFPLIANRPKTLPYMDALLLKDEDLTSPNDTTIKQLPVPPTLEVPPKPDKPEPEKTSQSEPPETPGKGQENAAPSDGDGAIDNPYLRPITMPRLKGGAKKYKWGAI